MTMLEQAIRKAVQNESIINPKIAARLIQELRQQTISTPTLFHELTAREVEILILLAYAKTNAEIAEHFTISENTVKSYISNILGKLNITNRTIFFWGFSPTWNRKMHFVPKLNKHWSVLLTSQYCPSIFLWRLKIVSIFSKTRKIQSNSSGHFHIWAWSRVDFIDFLFYPLQVGGNVFGLRESRSAAVQGSAVPSESNVLKDGTLIDLCGATLLWRSAEGDLLY